MFPLLGQRHSCAPRLSRVAPPATANDFEVFGKAMVRCVSEGGRLIPEMKTYAHFEHIIAFAILGALFGFAYPRCIVLVCCVVLGGAALLEMLQTLTPDRHGTLIDMMEKMAGGAAGIFLSRAVRVAGTYRTTRT